MERAKIFYALGCIILFLGLLWMFLPHATHTSFLQEDEEHETSHLLHTFEGAIAALLGLIILVASNHAMKRARVRKGG